jgi:glutathione synthase
MKICFIMYPWNEVDPKNDSTLILIHECVKRGHTVAITTPAKLTIRDSLTLAQSLIFDKDQVVKSNLTSFHKHAKYTEKMLPLEGFDVIFMRANPPMDPLALNFLDSIKNNVFMINSVRGLREANNKIYTASYYDPKSEIIPATYVSKNIDYLKSIIKEHDGGKMILKPLNGYGGKGVIVLEKSAMQNISSLLDFYVSGQQGKQSNYVILQDYVDGAEKGDVRVLMLHDQPIGAIRRVPGEGEARSNMSAGGHIAKHVLSKEEKELCRKIGKKLVADGIYFSGLDLISGKLIEVNVMSPGGLGDINKLYKVKLQNDIINYIEERVKNETSISRRKQEQRNFVDNV